MPLPATQAQCREPVEAPAKTTAATVSHARAPSTECRAGQRCAGTTTTPRYEEPAGRLMRAAGKAAQRAIRSLRPNVMRATTAPTVIVHGRYGKKNVQRSARD
eukprot:NODE_24570_length_619_cov_5.416667.p2 GENE.NODE_24570_length_619_cov_5.416667~~NODE_24570_length_619_cov_5.416667.p2  ORF type:complete len:103 (+),score=18.69 NODE_24570_length_619_cov_5.416667:73-381(+)